MIKMIMDLTNKVDSMQEQIGNVSRKMKILKKKKTKTKEMPKIKIHSNGKNAFDELISTIDTTKERL